LSKDHLPYLSIDERNRSKKNGKLAAESQDKGTGKNTDFGKLYNELKDGNFLSQLKLPLPNKQQNS
jgi:hypothetical protein